jgi:glycosyltransferase involved in cell wall biosynthesis
MLNHPPQISIITPSFNQGHFIEDTIESILSQNYKNLEYIIIDGGSSDNTLEIIRKYENRINYWVSEKDRGQADAINKGFKLAHGELLGWVNSDDILLPGCLSQIANVYNVNHGPDVIHVNFIYIDQNNRILKMINLPRQNSFFLEKGKWSVSQPAVFYKHSRLKEIGFLNVDLRLSMDLDLWVRLNKSGIKIAHLAQYLGAFRWHADSLTSHSIRGKRKRNDENPETQKILSQAFPATSSASRKFWRLIWRIYQLINGNYLIAYYLTWKNKGQDWKKIFKIK